MINCLNRFLRKFLIYDFQQVEIQGWCESDFSLGFLPMLEEKSHEEKVENDQDLEYDENEQTLENHHSKKYNFTKEVTYTVFLDEIWPRIGKKWSAKHNVSLIWREIMFIIKGSFEALSKPLGYLSKEEYINLGRKAAPNFYGERKYIYDIFKKYYSFKIKNFLFDEMDVIHNVFNRFVLLIFFFIKWIIKIN